MTLRMDKYTRFIDDGGGVPELWKYIPENSHTVYPVGIVGLKYSNSDTANITPVRGSILGNFNRLDFSVSGPVNQYTTISKEWVWKLFWHLYRIKNSALLEAFFNALFEQEECLTGLKITFTGQWFEGSTAVAKLQIGDNIYEAYNFVDLFNTVLFADEVIGVDFNNGLVIKLHARDTDLFVKAWVENANLNQTIKVTKDFHNLHRAYWLDFIPDFYNIPGTYNSLGSGRYIQSKSLRLIKATYEVDETPALDDYEAADLNIAIEHQNIHKIYRFDFDIFDGPGPIAANADFDITIEVQRPYFLFSSKNNVLYNETFGESNINFLENVVRSTIDIAEFTVERFGDNNNYQGLYPDEIKTITIDLGPKTDDINLYIDTDTDNVNINTFVQYVITPKKYITISLRYLLNLPRFNAYTITNYNEYEIQWHDLITGTDYNVLWGIYGTYSNSLSSFRLKLVGSTLVPETEPLDLGNYSSSFHYSVAFNQTKKAIITPSIFHQLDYQQLIPFYEYGSAYWENVEIDKTDFGTLNFKYAGETLYSTWGQLISHEIATDSVQEFVGGNYDIVFEFNVLGRNVGVINNKFQVEMPRTFETRDSNNHATFGGLGAIIDTTIQGSICYVENFPYKSQAKTLRANVLNLNLKDNTELTNEFYDLFTSNTDPDAAALTEQALAMEVYNHAAVTAMLNAYVKSKYTILVNNFASKELIEALGNGTYCIIPNFNQE